MYRKKGLISSLAIIIYFLFACSPTNDYLLLYQRVGVADNNCYLIHDAKTKEAALIDAPANIDIISAYIKENDLELKYIFLTQGHWDHVDGIHKILEQQPEAKLCYSFKEYEAMQFYREWFDENLYEIESLAVFRAPALQKIMEEFDLKSIKEPDIDVSDNQVFNIGSTQIKAILTPGHSPGSICYYAGNKVFTGDVLLKGYVGRTDVYGGSWEEQIKSIHKLYNLFSDDTKVYPGHYDFTDIGIEKKSNKNITENEVIGPFELVFL